MFLARVLEASFFQDFGESIAVSGRRSGNTPGGPRRVCAAERAASSIYISISEFTDQAPSGAFGSLRGSQLAGPSRSVRAGGDHAGGAMPEGPCWRDHAGEGRAGGAVPEGPCRGGSCRRGRAGGATPESPRRSGHAGWGHAAVAGTEGPRRRGHAGETMPEIPEIPETREFP